MRETILVKELLLSSSGYWVLNKSLVKRLGLETAFLLTNFAEAEQMLSDEEGWFYQTIKTVEEMTTLSRHKQEQSIEKLKELGILETDIRGVPPKRYFRLNYKQIAETIEITTLLQNAKNSQINMRNIDKSICEKFAPNKEHNIYKELTNKKHSESLVFSGGGSDGNTVSDEEFEEITNMFLLNGFGVLGESQIKELKALSEKYTADWVIDAMKISIDGNRRSLGYLKGILRRWGETGKTKSFKEYNILKARQQLADYEEL